MDPKRAGKLVQKVGQTITVQRAGQVDITCLASVRFFRPQELANAIIQGDREVTIGTDEMDKAGWPEPPARHDIVVINGVPTVIQSVEQRSIGDTPSLYVMQVRG